MLDQALAAAQQFASAHPIYYAVLAAAGGFYVRHFVVTKENAKRLVKAWFDRQRAALKKAGRSDEEIKSVMQSEAEFLASAAAEATAEADAEGKPSAP